MYLVNVITTPRPLYEYEYQFAICGLCFWCATIFHKRAIKEEQEEYIVESSNSNKPLAKDEIYTIAMEGKSKRGPEMEFSNCK
jgi:hypothetical protein